MRATWSILTGFSISCCRTYRAWNQTSFWLPTLELARCQSSGKFYSNKSKLLLLNEKVGVSSVKNGSATAFLTELISFETSNECFERFEALTKMPVSAYAIAVPKGAWYKPKLSQKILEYQFSGFLEKLLTSTTPAKVICQQKSQRLSYRNFATLFLVLLISIPLCVVMLMMEHIFCIHFSRWALQQTPDHPIHHPHLLFYSQELYRLLKLDLSQYTWENWRITAQRKLTQWNCGPGPVEVPRKRSYLLSFYDVCNIVIQKRRRARTFSMACCPDTQHNLEHGLCSSQENSLTITHPTVWTTDSLRRSRSMIYHL